MVVGWIRRNVSGGSGYAGGRRSCSRRVCRRVEVAAVLEVSTKSAYRWRRLWVAGGSPALVSKGASGPDPKLSDEQLARLTARLELGLAAAGYGEDQRWTLARIAALIATMFHLRVGITTVWQAMRRLGYTAQLPTYRAIERDEQAIAHWRRYQWPALKGACATQDQRFGGLGQLPKRRAL
jgi:transposase